MDVVWCCCSAGRPDLLVRKTLATLQRGNFSGSLYVVVPTDEVVAYTRALTKSPVHCIILHTDRGLVKQRKFFRSQMADNTPIIWIDDDVEAIKIKTPTGLQHCRILPMLAAHMVQMLASTDDGLLLGVYPVANRAWMSPTVFRNNSYISGAFYATINDSRLTEADRDELEDEYRALSEQAAGRPVLRLNYVGIQTQYFKNPGGMQTERKPETREATVSEYAQQFSAMVKRIVRKSGIPDLRYLGRPERYDTPGSADHAMLADQSTASASPPSESAPADLSGQGQ